MRWHMTLPDSVSGWCFWVSFVALLVVIGATLPGPAAAAIGGESAVEILWKVVQFGFAGLVVSFLLGVVCSQIEQFMRKSGRE